MKTRLFAALAFVCAGIATPSIAAAQEAEDPFETARFRLGPVRFTPGIRITSVGSDSNVFNESEDPKSDTTAAFGPGVELWMRPLGTRFSGKFGGQYLYFKDWDSQRSWNTAMKRAGKCRSTVTPSSPHPGALERPHRLRNRIRAPAAVTIPTRWGAAGAVREDLDCRQLPPRQRQVRRGRRDFRSGVNWPPLSSRGTSSRRAGPLRPLRRDHFVLDTTFGPRPLRPSPALATKSQREQRARDARLRAQAGRPHLGPDLCGLSTVDPLA